MDWYIDAFVNAFDFKGRARRKEYWMFFLSSFIIGFVVGFLVKITHTPMMLLVPVAYQLLVFIPHLSLAVRRMHDVNKSAWYLLIPIYSFYLLIKDGDQGPNPYGPDPKKRSSALTEPIKINQAA